LIDARGGKDRDTKKPEDRWTITDLTRLAGVGNAGWAFQFEDTMSPKDKLLETMRKHNRQQHYAATQRLKELHTINRNRLDPKSRGSEGSEKVSGTVS
jgi:hypothetical protein